MKNKLVVVFCLLISACATQEPQNTTENNNDIVAKILKEKLSKNGAALFCDQEGYLSCYGISNSTCQTEMTPMNSICIEKADKKFGGLTSANTSPYAKYFGECMILQHILAHPSNDLNELSKCLSKLQYKKEAGTRSLMK